MAGPVIIYGASGIFNGSELAVRDPRGAEWFGGKGAVLAVAGADGTVRLDGQAPRDGARAIVLEALPPREEEGRHAFRSL